MTCIRRRELLMIFAVFLLACAAFIRIMRGFL